MSVKMRQHVERMIARRIVNDALHAGYAISVDNGGDEYEITHSTDRRAILAAMFQTDDEHLVMRRVADGKRVGTVHLVYGNDGWDVVNDYSISLEHIMAGADQLAEKFQ